MARTYTDEDFYGGPRGEKRRYFQTEIGETRITSYYAYWPVLLTLTSSPMICLGRGKYRRHKKLVWFKRVYVSEVCCGFHSVWFHGLGQYMRVPLFRKSLSFVL